MSEKELYFNIPITILDRFLINLKPMQDILDYSLYAHSLNYEFGTELECIVSAKKFYNVSGGNDRRMLEKGKELYEGTPLKTPMVGLNLSIFWDYYKNDKTDFEKATLLGFLALKSILQDKPYCKVVNKFWLARMDGKAKAVKDYSELSESIRKYANEYQTKKIKTELELNWFLISYSRYTRGFYVSFKLGLDKLALEVEKRKKKSKQKLLKLKKEEAYKKAMESIKF
jgi:hypothetical protein